MFGRMLNLLKAKVNKGLSGLETPEVLAEEAMSQLEDNLKSVKDGIVSSLANEKTVEQELKKDRENLASWEKRAALAVQQNNDDVARQCLEKKQELQQKITELEAQLEGQRKTTADLKSRYAEVEQKLREFRQKKDGMMARSQANEAVAKANDLLSGGPSGMDQWEQKIQEKEFRSEGLQGVGKDPEREKLDDLQKKTQLDDELEALKSRMNPPKLVVHVEDSESPVPTNTVVDDNLPMVIDENDETKTDPNKT
jgi:phage shock protein A